MSDIENMVHYDWISIDNYFQSFSYDTYRSNLNKDVKQCILRSMPDWCTCEMQIMQLNTS